MNVQNESLNQLLFFIFDMLSIDDKIRFVDEYLNLSDEDDFTELLYSYVYKTKLGKMNSDIGMSFIFYNKSNNNRIVDICINDKTMHFNSNFPTAMRAAIMDFFKEGFILTKSETKKDSEIFKKRYYKCYSIVNINNAFNHILFN